MVKNDPQPIRSKDDIIETVIDIFVRTIGFIDRKDVFATTNVVEDFYINTDDLSLFARAISKRFDIKPTQEEWLNVETIDEITDLVLHHLHRKQ